VPSATNPRKAAPPQPEGVTGRDGYIVAKALAYAIATIDALPFRWREGSDADDRRRLLRAHFSKSDAPSYAHHHTHLPCNVNADLDEEALWDASSEAERDELVKRGHTRRAYGEHRSLMGAVARVRDSLEFFGRRGPGDATAAYLKAQLEILEDALRRINALDAE